MITVQCSSRWWALCWLAVFAVFVPASLSGQVLTPAPAGPSWPQWGLNSQHTLFLNHITGQPINNVLASFTYDFNVAAEKADPNAAPGRIYSENNGVIFVAGK